LQAGELELAKIKKQFDEANEAGFGLSQNDIWRWLSASHSHNAAKVEVTKAVVDEAYAALLGADAVLAALSTFTRKPQRIAQVTETLTLLNKFKEVL
jgi:hypothetical protein